MGGPAGERAGARSAGGEPPTAEVDLPEPGEGRPSGRAVACAGGAIGPDASVTGGASAGGDGTGPGGTSDAGRPGTNEGEADQPRARGGEGDGGPAGEVLDEDVRGEDVGADTGEAERDAGAGADGDRVDQRADSQAGPAAGRARAEEVSRDTATPAGHGSRAEGGAGVRADAAGPWSVRDEPGGRGLPGAGAGETPERGFRPSAEDYEGRRRAAAQAPGAVGAIRPGAVRTGQ